MSDSVVDAADKPHQCSVCSKTFTRSDLLKRHSQLHKDSASPKDGSPHKRQKLSSDVQEVNSALSSTLGPLPEVIGNSGAAEAMSNGATQSIVDQSPSSVIAFSDDGGLDFNDLAIWSEHTFFDMPFAGSSSTFPTAWDDFLPFDLSHGAHDPATQRHEALDTTEHGSHQHDGHSTSISRAPSPPNEASGEDKTPFAWSPSSKRITAPKEVRLDPHDPCYAISTHVSHSVSRHTSC